MAGERSSFGEEEVGGGRTRTRTALTLVVVMFGRHD